MAKKATKSLRSPAHLALRQILVNGRKKAGLTQAETAAALGWPQSDISKVETGERRLDVIEFLQLCEAIGIDPTAVIDQLQAAQ